MTYPIDHRAEYHSRVELGLWRNWTPGFDEPPGYWGNGKLMTSHHMEGGTGGPCWGWPSLQRTEYIYTARGVRQHT